MPAKVILEVTAGPIKGKRFTFDSHDTCLFGRGRNCNERLPNDGLVSRHQFMLEVNPPDARLRDLMSLNGTYVNGVKHGGRNPEESPEEASGQSVPEVDLKDGDCITAGNTVMQVTVSVPLTCYQCSAEIPDDDRQFAEWAPGIHMCQECRGSAPTGTPVAPPPPVDMPVCDQCGKDVSSEIGSSRRGQYVCAACRSGLMSHGGDVRVLIGKAARGGGGRSEISLDDYEVAEQIGKGGMGFVHKAIRKSDGLPVAVKTMIAQVAVDETAAQMFLREIDVTRKLSHPNVVRLLDHGTTGSVFYFVMELCGGGNLDSLRQKLGGKLPLPTFAPIMLQCLAGLEYAHAEGVVHRDLKPQNILLQQDVGEWVAKVCDFGLAKSFEQTGLSGMTATGSYGGTYWFMPREQLTNFKEALPVSDVWSIAATIYVALAGQYPRDVPRDADPMNIVLEAKSVPIRKRERSIPPAVAQVIDRALSIEPSARFQDAGHMCKALKQALA